jgi:hypothetical protein
MKWTIQLIKGMKNGKNRMILRRQTWNYLKIVSIVQNWIKSIFSWIEKQNFTQNSNMLKEMFFFNKKLIVDIEIKSSWIWIIFLKFC